MVLALVTCAPAFASTLSDTQARAAALKAQIATLDTKISMADESYNVARDKHATLTAEVGAAARRIAKLQVQNDALQSSLAARANQIYRSDGELGVIAALLSTRTLADFDSVLQAVTRIAESDASMVDALTRTAADLSATRRSLVAAQTQAAAQEVAMASNVKAIRQRLTARTKTLASTSADIRRLVADEQARRDAAARARYLADRAAQRAQPGRGSGGGASGGGSGAGPSVGGSSKGAAAVRQAEKALGRPYVWAASGPSSFDCSGLTMWAYAHVGVSLPHSSRAQIGYGSRVAKSALQPGDLVFFGSPIHHVGMYVGGGEFIEAPHSGAVVRIATLGDRSDFAGACRPY